MMKVFLDNEGKLREALEGTDARTTEVRQGMICSIGCLPDGVAPTGTAVGITAVVDGQPVYVETSLKLLQLAVIAFTTKYGDETGRETVVIADLAE